MDASLSKASGSVTIRHLSIGTDTLLISLNIEGIDGKISAHVHEGTSCETADDPLGHFRKGSTDPWTSVKNLKPNGSFECSHYHLLDMQEYIYIDVFIA